jgi:transcriptional regulator with XRE-family HTH domain
MSNRGDTEIGNLLRELRGTRSLRDIQKISGVSYSHLRNIENGYDPRSGKPINPTPDILKKLSKAYHFSYRQLMKLAGYVDEDYDEEASLDDNLINVLRSLSEDGYFFRFLHEELFNIFEEYFTSPDFERFNSLFRQYLNTRIKEPDYIDEELHKEFDEVYNLRTVKNDIIRRNTIFDEWKEVLLDELVKLAQKHSISIRDMEHHDLSIFIQRPDITYKGRPLSDSDRQSIKDMLEVLFRDRNKDSDKK